MNRIPVILLLSLALSPCVAAENPGAMAPDPSPVRERGLEWFPMGGVKYDSVTGLTGAGCVCFHVGHLFARPNEDGIVMCSHNFLILQVEAGQGGGKVQVGLGAWYLSGCAGKLSLLRTWGDPAGTEPDQTLLGVELQFNMLLLNGAVGVYTELDGHGERETLLTWSTGIGF